jgi:hypothetical protein
LIFLGNILDFGRKIVFVLNVVTLHFMIAASASEEKRAKVGNGLRIIGSESTNPLRRNIVEDIAFAKHLRYATSQYTPPPQSSQTRSRTI